MIDVIIVGAGPCGLACGIEAQKKGLSYLVIDKGSITESVRNFPSNMTFFSTAEMISIGDIPFNSLNFRPNRIEALKYYRSVVKHYDLNISLFTEVESVNKKETHFVLHTNKGDFTCRKVILATGYYSKPKLLDIPGEDLPHVSHYFDDVYRYTNTYVTIVGGANSAVDNALELYRNGAHVTLIHRKDQLYKGVKYWMRPDIENRIKNRDITAYYNTEVTEIMEGKIIVRNNEKGEVNTIKSDFVFLMTGYTPDASFLKRVGINLIGNFLVPETNPNTFETNIEGIYVAGSLLGGEETAKIFIENGREHGKHIISNIAKHINL